MLANSAHRLGFRGDLEGRQRGLGGVNALAERFGITVPIWYPRLPEELVGRRSHPLMEGVVYLDLAPGNGVPFA